jgi:hypothetical protein
MASTRDEHTLDFIKDRYSHMRRLESTTYKRPTRIDEPYNGQWRQQIVEWMYTIVHSCNLRHETVAAASYFLDVSVWKGLIQTPIDYQVAAMTAFHLALKIYDSPSTRVVKLDSLVKLGSGGFDEQEVLQMETKLVFMLDWRLNPPTPNCFLHQYLELLPKDTHSSTLTKIEQYSLKAIEAAVSTDYFALVGSSMIAYAVMLVAFEKLDQSDMSVDALGEFLSNISEVTQVESNSHNLVRYTILLDCIMRNLPLPLQEEGVSGDAVCEQQLFCGDRSESNSHSPNHVALQ